jgi:glycine/D-amino acid oxidase-like deaminating enzyme/nitrite reductase/ring-hydroxylating ferredoxin subunit
MINNKERFFMERDTIPYWIGTTEETNYPELIENIEIDVAVVGGGIAGITTAYLLRKEGYRVAVIEADKICKATTAHTTAKITSQHALIYDKAIKTFGKDMVQQYADANEYAIKFMADLVKTNNIQCDYETKAAYVFTQDEKYVNKIRNEAEAAASLGIPAEFVTETPLPFPVLGAVKFNAQAQFHPRKYVLALAKEIPKDGSYIFEGTRAVDIEEGETCTIKTAKGKKIRARHVVIASHYPFYDGKVMYFAKMYPSRSYLMAFKIYETPPDGMFINVDTPGMTLRSQIHQGGEILLFGGEAHKTAHGEQTSTHYENLRKLVRKIFTVKEELYHWSTQDYYTLDEIPYIGRLTADTSCIYVATGFRKWGMTNGTVAALIIKDLIIKGKSPWEGIYSPQRATTGTGAASFLAQNLDVAYQLISGKLENPDDDIDIKNGEGKVVEYKGKRTGVYKDEQGKLYLLDITCTHMGCELKWNDAEKTWDCPCHGSRFKYNGDIVEGPALYALNHPDEGRNVVEPNVIKTRRN